MSKKPISIRQRLCIAMITLLLFISIVFILLIRLNGTFGIIVSSAYGDLSNTAALRTGAAEVRLNSVSDTLIYNYDKFNDIMIQCSQDMDGKIDYNDAFTQMLPYTEFLSGNDLISGIFVFGGNDATRARIPAIYLSRSDINLKNQSFSFKIADESVINNSNIFKSPSWSRTFNAKESSSLDFITEPVRMAEEHPDTDISKLGYWSLPYDINFDRDYSIAYCLPLKDTDGTCLGVLGVQVSLEHLKTYLPYLELNSRGEGSYCVVRSCSEDPNLFRKIAVSGKSFNRINNYSDTVTVGKKTNYDSIFTLETQNKNTTYAAINPLDLNGNSEYSDYQWLLLGVVDEAYLNMSGNNVKLNILFVFSIAILVGIVFAFIASTVAAYPIHRFLTELKRISPLNPVPPSRSGVDELDDLGATISRLTSEIVTFSSRLSDIISLTESDFGAFEYSREQETVLCTDMMFELLNIEKTEDSLFIPRAVFEERMAAFCHTITPGIDQIYKINLPGGTSKYIRLKTTINNGKILGIIQDTTTETVKASTMKHIKDHDALTNLFNRNAFRRILNEKFSSANVSVAALVHCDIDNMADINSRYGNAIGDRCLSSLGAIFKKYHDRITCFAARTAGDEFKMILFGYNRVDMEKNLRKIFDEIFDLKIQTSQGVFNMHSSIGVAWYPDDSTDANLLEQYAEFTMYQVKEEGKNTYKNFDKKAFEAAELNFKTIRNIETIISEGMLKYAFQPIINTQNGEIYGYEALMRPKGDSSVNPHDVIIFATEHNMLGDIEKLTWFNALDDFSMQNENVYGKKIFINSIPNEMLKDEELRELEESYGEYLSSVVLEIIENEQSDNDILNRKKKLTEKWGCLLAMDDYGSGYSNDNTLLSLKPDIIKLDIEMITGIETDNDRQTLVKNIISYAHQRNIMVLAEGIECGEQLKVLIEYGVDLLQGFYLAKPDFEAIDQIDEAKKDEIIKYRNERYGK